MVLQCVIFLNLKRYGLCMTVSFDISTISHFLAFTMVGATDRPHNIKRVATFIKVGQNLKFWGYGQDKYSCVCLTPLGADGICEWHNNSSVQLCNS